MRIAPEGRKIVYTLLIINVLIINLNLFDQIPIFPSILLIILLLFCINFFRDPNRVIPNGDNQIISPADGKIIAIRTIQDDELGEVKLISIFLNIFNVHVNRMPFKGTFSNVYYKKGKFLMAFDHKASEMNERNEIIIQSKLGIIKVIQITGLIARRIICYAKKGEKMDKGDRLGFMLFGSRTDLILPTNVNLKVKLGQKVVGNTTIIATFS